MEDFKTIAENCTGQILQKKSKFIANIYNVESSEEAEEKIKQIKKKYYDARHNCYAYRVVEKDESIIEKCSDDGEPSGTAGAPMLNILKTNNYCNVLAIVTRYFGGILLGTGGLVRAYTQATLATLENANNMIKEKGQIIKVILDYSNVESFKHYCKKNGITIVNEEYLESVEILIEISDKKIINLNNEIDKDRLKIQKKEIIKQKYIKRNTDG